MSDEFKNWLYNTSSPQQSITSIHTTEYNALYDSYFRNIETWAETQYTPELDYLLTDKFLTLIQFNTNLINISDLFT